MDVQALRERFRALRLSGASAEAWESFEFDVFRFQAVHNPVYARFLEALNVRVESVDSVEHIPYLPVEAFVHHSVGSGETVFRSSGTMSGGRRAEHAVDDVEWYDEVAVAGFEREWGGLTGWVVGGLLPGYLGRGDASLVHMVRAFGRRSAWGEAGLFDRAGAEWTRWVEAAVGSGAKVLLVGVTHALLRWLPQQGWSNGANVVVMETGGMKGMGEELIREEVHARLRSATGLSTVSSEYGMTECLSQAYARGGGRFAPPPWLRVRIVEVDDPLQNTFPGGQGRICLSDLANLHSCAFLATGDLGRQYGDGTFDVLGRHDRAEVRGCNLML
ncbi:MAG: acyl transferase [Flavobacteriales bacterium]|jgi:hypothetical protein